MKDTEAGEKQNGFVSRVTNIQEEKIMFLNEKEFTKSITIKESEHSPILIAKSELVVPERKIVLLNDMTEEEIKFAKTLGYKGGIIV